MDVGIYCLQTARMLDRRGPDLDQRHPRSRPTRSSSAKSTKPSCGRPSSRRGVVANRVSTYNANGLAGFRAATTRGWFGLDPAYFYNGNRGRRSDNTEINIPVDRPVRLELEDFADCIINKKPITRAGRDGTGGREVPDGHLRVDQEGAPRLAGVNGDIPTLFDVELERADRQSFGVEEIAQRCIGPAEAHACRLFGAESSRLTMPPSPSCARTKWQLACASPHSSKPAGSFAPITMSRAVEVPERHFHAGGGAPHGLRLGARSGQLLAERHVPRGARQALAHVQLVGRMNIVAIADVDGHRETGIAILEHRAPLRIAQPRPATIYRRGRERDSSSRAAPRRTAADSRTGGASP